MPSCSGIFQFGIFWVLPIASPVLCFPWGLLRILILLSCYLFIQHFRYLLSVFIFYSKLTLFLLPPVVDLSLCTLNQLVGRIFFYNFGMFCFCLYCLILPYYLLSLPSFANIFWFISSSCAVKLVCDCIFLGGSVGFLHNSHYSVVSFAVAVSFCPSCLISHPGFVFLLRFLRGISFFF